MITLFRKIRQKFLLENKFINYSLYAFGEIILVVVGILIALQINTWNEERIARAIEINYLKNLQSDITKEINNNEEMITLRYEKTKAAQKILTMKDLKTRKDFLNYELLGNTVFSWRYFIPNNNSFKELISSGNLNSIQSDSIKFYLLELDQLYQSIENAEHHMRREYEQYLYDILLPNTESFNFFDFEKIVENKNYDLIELNTITASKLKELEKDFQWIIKNKAFRNGLKLTILNNIGINTEHIKMRVYLTRLSELIQKDISKH